MKWSHKPFKGRLHGTRAKRKRIEELLEVLWILKEEGKESLEDINDNLGEAGKGASLDELESLNLIRISGERIEFTEEGTNTALGIIRRHRLAEQLLSEIFDIDEESAETHACEFEHVLSPQVTDSVCTFLGHPPRCPHGKTIPRGDCCRIFKKDVEPLVTPLKDFQVGMEGRIVFISPKEHETIDKLSGFGLIPGSIIKLHQKKPTIVIMIGETDLALDPDIARHIYVKRV